MQINCIELVSAANAVENVEEKKFNAQRDDQIFNVHTFWSKESRSISTSFNYIKTARCSIFNEVRYTHRKIHNTTLVASVLSLYSTYFFPFEKKRMLRKKIEHKNKQNFIFF